LRSPIGVGGVAGHIFRPIIRGKGLAESSRSKVGQSGGIGWYAEPDHYAQGSAFGQWRCLITVALAAAVPAIPCPAAVAGA
jgi:hypothetical protein